MAYEYLKLLGLSDEDEHKLRSLGARTPLALLSMVEHARDKFGGYLNDIAVPELLTKLKALVSPEELAKVNALPEFRGHFGAELLPRVTNSEQSETIRRRDQLMNDIKTLRESPEQSREKDELIEKLEALLRDLLKATVSATRQSSA